MIRPGLTPFEELYVISDLHMGGPPGVQVMNRGDRLGRLISQLAAERPGDRVGLVINGDVFDSLAEEFDGYIAVSDAEGLMDRLYRDSTFEPVWSALARFVRQPLRRLVLTIGNHDIEMGLPAVQESIRRRLAGDDDAARGRIEFATGGEGYACVVGGARVFCTHGNEVDGWNVVDYNALRELAAQQNAGRPFERERWTPNAGTRLVRDVMNAVKRRYPWIDLLKPETHAAVGVLLVMDPGQVRRLSRAIPVVYDRIRGELRLRGLLSADWQAATESSVALANRQAELPDLLGTNLLSHVNRHAAVTAGVGSGTLPSEDMLLDVERAFAAGTLSAGSPELEGTLGWGQMLIDRLRGTNRVEALRRALIDWLAEDRSFDIEHRDRTARELLRRVGSDVEFVLAGHTHLERAIIDGTRAYYNTGTWIRVMRFTTELLQNSAAFEQLYRLLEQGTLADLDAATVPAPGNDSMPLMMDDTTAARISVRPDGIVGCLCHVKDQTGGGVRLEVVKGSEYRRR